MFKTFRDDIAACMARDPAARSKLEVILAYPGFHGVVWYRMSSLLWPSPDPALRCRSENYSLH